MKAVANQPVSVAVDGGDMTFEIYSVGVMTSSCGIGLDHGIAAIRYRKASDGTKYWLMKNSWGTTCGENALVKRGMPCHEAVLLYRIGSFKCLQGIHGTDRRKLEIDCCLMQIC